MSRSSRTKGKEDRAGRIERQRDQECEQKVIEMFWPQIYMRNMTLDVLQYVLSNMQAEPEEDKRAWLDCFEAKWRSHKSYCYQELKAQASNFLLLPDMDVVLQVGHQNLGRLMLHRSAHYSHPKLTAKVEDIEGQAA